MLQSAALCLSLSLARGQKITIKYFFFFLALTIIPTGNINRRETRKAGNTNAQANHL